ncbi:MAG: GNAT family N-acetyltransferase [Chloroflexota bacterium]
MNHYEDQVIIRRASLADADIITELTAAAYSRHVPRLGRLPQPMTADYRQMVAEHPIWLLYLGSEPAGVLVLIVEAEALLIYSVAISPPHQKQGLGRRLLAWAEQEARRAGYTLIRLYTNVLMEENVALYRRLGYEETGRESYLGSTLVHMAKPLTVA